MIPSSKESPLNLRLIGLWVSDMSCMLVDILTEGRTDDGVIMYYRAVLYKDFGNGLFSQQIYNNANRDSRRTKSTSRKVKKITAQIVAK